MINREVQSEVIVELNEFIIQLEDERNETSAKCDLNESLQSGESNESITDEECDLDESCKVEKLMKVKQTKK